MYADEIREHCLAKAGVTEETPFGDDVLVYKVLGKMFALIALDEVPVRINLKCDPDRAVELRDQHESILPGYHMNKRHWNTLVMDCSIGDALERELIDDSYDLVVAGLPKSKRAELERGGE